jgi:hypothetical protein
MDSLQDCFEAVGLSEMLADDARFATPDPVAAD